MSKVDVFKDEVIDLILALAKEKEVSPHDLDEVDDFYGYLGYVLELNNLLIVLGIESSSDLQELLLG